MLIVRGDVFPCASRSLSHLSIALGHHGTCARQPAYYWVIGMAMCGDKDMAQLGAIWGGNPQVWLPPTLSCFVSLCSRSNLNVKRSKNVQNRAELPKLCVLNFKMDFWTFKILICFQILQHIYDTGRFTQAIMEHAATIRCAGDNPLIRRWVGVSIPPQVESIYNKAT